MTKAGGQIKKMDRDKTGVDGPLRPAEMDGVLDAAREGGEWAWEIIYGHMGPAVLGYLTAKGAHDPEDLLGEVFLQAVRNLDGFQGDYGDFRAWLLTIAHRRIVDEYRRKQRRPLHLVEVEEIERLGPHGDAELESLTRIDATRVISAISRLSPAQRDVLLLRLVADLSNDEVARVLGKRPGAIKALQRRGLATLRKEISKQGISR